MSNSEPPQQQPGHLLPQQHSPRHYIRRRGRMTQGQAKALQDCAYRARLLGESSVEQVLATPPNWAEIFTGAEPLLLGVEIGFGMGQALVQWAQQQPQLSLVGIEVYQPGIGSLLLQAQQLDLLNRLYVLEGDARAALALAFAPQTLSEVRIFFPDPWHKARHNKRRLVQREFLQLVQDRLVPGGVLRMATDWQDYAQWMLAAAEATPGLINAAGAGCFAERYAERELTRFEQRGQRLGHQVWDLEFVVG